MTVLKKFSVLLPTKTCMVIDSFVADGALLFVETIPSLSLKIIALYYRQNF
jgi:hypothetical protein